MGLAGYARSGKGQSGVSKALHARTGMMEKAGVQDDSATPVTTPMTPEAEEQKAEAGKPFTEAATPFGADKAP